MPAATIIIETADAAILDMLTASLTATAAEAKHQGYPVTIEIHKGRMIEDDKEMTTLLFGVNGPTTATTDDLINAAREAIARDGYQVGEWNVEQEVQPGSIALHLDVEMRLWHKLENKGHIEFNYGPNDEYEITAEMP